MLVQANCRKWYGGGGVTYYDMQATPLPDTVCFTAGEAANRVQGGSWVGREPMQPVHAALCSNGVVWLTVTTAHVPCVWPHAQVTDHSAIAGVGSKP